MFHATLADDVELRQLTHDDADELFALTDRERDRLREWLPWVDHTTSPEDSLAFIRASLERHARDGSFDAGIRVGGRLAGVVGLHEVDRANRKTSIGYWIGSGFEGRGLVTAGVRAALAYCFSSLELNRVEIRAAVPNRRSRAVPERLGFTLEGVAREVELVDGRFLDHAVYSMLAGAWESG